MRSIVLVLAMLVVGCAEGATESMNAPDPGGAHDGAAPDTGEGGTDVSVCNAPVETLSGKATYVAGSATAADPNLETGLAGTPTCGDWVHAYAMQLSQQVEVIAGAIGGQPAQLVTTFDTAQGCAYRLRHYQDAIPNSNRPCALSVDYTLVVP